MFNKTNMSDNSKKWLNHYEKLISRSKNRSIENNLKYVERHHIIPKSMNGSNDEINIAFLTPEEHYIAHLLLVKIFPNNFNLAYAANMMCVSTRYVKRNNKLYGWLRRKISEATSNKFKGKHLSDEHKQKLSIALKGKSNKKLIGRKLSNEHKNKIRKKLKNRILSDEHKNKIGKGNKGKIISKETKLKLSICAKNRKRPSRTRESYDVMIENLRKRSKYSGTFKITHNDNEFMHHGDIWQIAHIFNTNISSIKNLLKHGKPGNRGKVKNVTIIKI